MMRAARSAWTIRRATANDAAALTALAERTFRETFSETNTAEDMEAYCAGAFGVEIQKRELEDPATLTLVVEHNGGLIGYAQLVAQNGNRAVVAERPIELKRFYIDKAFHGSALARELMRATEERAVAEHADVVWLGVWEHNPRAIRFYRKCGFIEVGEQIFTVGADPQRDLVMSRHLGDH